MLAEERRQAIAEMVRRGGRGSLTELSGRFSVSVDTIRRDLTELDSVGAIRKVRGGALRRSPAPVSYRARIERDLHAKSRIAELAAQHIEPGMVVGIDNGTTSIQLIREIPEHLAFTAVTTNLPLAIELGERQAVTVLVPGGEVMGPAQAVMGSTTCSFLGQVRLDVSIISACGIDIDAGLTAINLPEANVKRFLVRQATRTIVLATQEKLGTVEPFQFATVQEIDLLLTDASQASLEAFLDRQVPIQIVR